MNSSAVSLPDLLAKAGIGLAAIAVLVVIALLLYVFFSYCYKRICLKAGHEPGALVWIPIAQLVPMLTIAGLPLWLILLFFIPCVSLLAWCYMWFKICERLGHGIGFVIGVILLPIIFIPLLAFGQSPNQVDSAQ
jgi:hypothetical protein